MIKYCTAYVQRVMVCGVLCIHVYLLCIKMCGKGVNLKNSDVGEQYAKTMGTRSSLSTTIKDLV